MNQSAENELHIALIVAMANNGVIGRNNALPWRIPEDLQYFKKLTLGKKILMGRKTFESIGSPLPGRISIVVTRDKHWLPNIQKQQSQNLVVVHTVEEGLQQAVNLSLRDGNREVMVVGGEQIYRETLCSAKRLYITRVFADVEGDASFPEIDNKQWREVERHEYQASPPNTFNFAFTVLERVTNYD